MEREFKIECLIALAEAIVIPEFGYCEIKSISESEVTYRLIHSINVEEGTINDVPFKTVSTAKLKADAEEFFECYELPDDYAEYFTNCYKLVF